MMEAGIMSLFDALLGAIANPQQQASMDGLGSMVGAMQQLSGQHGVDPGMMQTVLSMVGGQVRSSLQDQHDTMGADHVTGLVNQFSGMGANAGAVNALFGPQIEQQLAGQIAQHTGMDSNIVMALLPTLVPIALQFLQSGGVQGAAPVQQQQQGNAFAGNPLLNAFLDKNHDGGVDMGDAMNMAAQFLQNR
jgi:hypothetical protein